MENLMTQLAAPDYSNLLAEQWSETLNLIANILHVPTALIMKLEDKNIKVFAKNDNPSNPYQINDHEVFDGSGLYCEYVIKKQQMLEVNNALTDPNWRDNPDVKLKMIYYLGLPLNYSDGTPFGTICVLDSAEQVAKEEYKALMVHIKTSVEQQLRAYELQQQIFERKNLKHIEHLICAMAHELNTPIGVSVTAISALSNKLNEFNDKFHQHTLSKSDFVHFLKHSEQCIALLSSNLAKTAALIERFRHISNQLTLNKIRLNLVQFFEEMQKSYQRCYHEQVSFQIAIDETVTFVTIPMLVQSVIGQLVENAVTHAFAANSVNNHVLITAKVLADELVITIADNGKGFKLADTDEIFSPSIQSSEQDSHIGLGLCIVHKTVLVQLEGTIKLKPSDTGSVFEIRLPSLKE